MSRVQQIHNKVQNRITYWKILARKRGVTLNPTNLARLKKAVEDNVLPDDMTLNELFKYRYMFIVDLVPTKIKFIRAYVDNEGRIIEV
jgi:hypothetical protein